MKKPSKGSAAAFVLGAALGVGGTSQVGPSEQEIAKKASDTVDACMTETPVSPMQMQKRLQVCLAEARK